MVASIAAVRILRSNAHNKEKMDEVEAPVANAQVVEDGEIPLASEYLGLYVVADSGALISPREPWPLLMYRPSSQGQGVSGC